MRLINKKIKKAYERNILELALIERLVENMGPVRELEAKKNLDYLI